MDEQTIHNLSQRDPLDLMRDHELAKRWGKSTRTLQRWRAEHYGPPHCLIGGTIYFRVSDVLAFEHAQRRGGSADR